MLIMKKGRRITGRKSGRKLCHLGGVGDLQVRRGRGRGKGRELGQALKLN